MKKTYIIFTLVLALVFVSCNNNTEGINTISAKEVSEKMKDDKVVLLDVRTPGEYEGGHVPNSILNNVMSGDFDQKMEKMDKRKVYYVYCKSGRRSMKACQKMKAMGFKNLYNVDGGFMQWKADGLVSE